MIEVHAKYTFQGGFSFDHVAEQAAGRAPDFSGCGFGERDMGWVCQSEFEAERIKRALTKVGLTATIAPAEQKTAAKPATDMRQIFSDGDNTHRRPK